MPISSYYGGHGQEVMASMQRQHGDEGGKRVFYATANKRGKRGSKKHSKRKHKKDDRR